MEVNACAFWNSADFALVDVLRVFIQAIFLCPNLRHTYLAKTPASPHLQFLPPTAVTSEATATSATKRLYTPTDSPPQPRRWVKESREDCWRRASCKTTDVRASGQICTTRRGCWARRTSLRLSVYVYPDIILKTRRAQLLWRDGWRRRRLWTDLRANIALCRALHTPRE